MTAELKPCPFCGSPARLHKHSAGLATCSNSDECTIAIYFHPVSDWNRRPEAQDKVDAEQLVRDTMLTSAGPDHVRGGFALHFEGGACALFAEAFVEQFKGANATNYIEAAFHHKELGPFTVTMQRVEGKTPHQLRAEAERELAAMRQGEKG